jgi:hypothetical protein
VNVAPGAGGFRAAGVKSLRFANGEDGGRLVDGEA